MLDAAAIARLCAWLERAELPRRRWTRCRGVQTFDLELLRRRVPQSVQVGHGDHGSAVFKLRYLAARYASPEIGVVAPIDERPQPPAQRAY
jgi:hypothetical protein